MKLYFMLYNKKWNKLRFKHVYLLTFFSCLGSYLAWDLKGCPQSTLPHLFKAMVCLVSVVTGHLLLQHFDHLLNFEDHHRYHHHHHFYQHQTVVAMCTPLLVLPVLIYIVTIKIIHRSYLLCLHDDDDT